MYITKQINVPKTSHLEKSLVVTVFLPGSLFFLPWMCDALRKGRIVIDLKPNTWMSPEAR